jgi:hypothetical protein
MGMTDGGGPSSRIDARLTLMNDHARERDRQVLLAPPRSLFVAWTQEHKGYRGAREANPSRPVRGDRELTHPPSSGQPRVVT